MRKPWIICALMGWGMFALAMFTPQQAPAGSDQRSDSEADGGGAALGSPCQGDVNNDLLVNIDDLVMVIVNWGACNPQCQTAAQCNDNDPCTTDICQMGECVNTPIPNCCQGAGECAAVPNGTVGCVQNVCVITACNAGFADCDSVYANGCEINTNTNATNCGQCGMACQFANATSACVNGQCVIAACNPGFSNCDGLLANGCEVNTNNNVANCGACGNFCTFPNATAGCVNGQCVIAACNPGFSDCDGLVVNGCEVNIGTNSMHCGQCGNFCTFPNAAAVCQAGQCGLGPCNTGFSNCDNIAANGCEVFGTCP